jgi:TM2 domain-containing membrane protein YozV
LGKLLLTNQTNFDIIFGIELFTDGKYEILNKIGATVLSRRSIAVILSAIYCGLGQIYNGQLIKGIDLIIIYTMLIISTFSSSTWLSFAGISAIPFLWFVGVVDAYFHRSHRPVYARKWVLPVIFGICLSGIAALVQFFLIMNSPAKVDLAQNQPNTQKIEIDSNSNPEVQNVEQNELDTDVKDNPEPDQDGNEYQAVPHNPGSGYFSIQVAAFKQLSDAKKLLDELLYKGYSARIESPDSQHSDWYRVLIGKFYIRQDAIKLAKEISEQEKLFYIIVHRSE